MLGEITNHKYWFFVRTKSKPFVEGGKPYVITVKYGIDADFAARHNQAPYFSITASIVTKRGSDVSGGMIHDEIEKHFPELAHLTKWHLVGMHYVANSTYWMELYRGWKPRSGHSDEKALDHFKSTCKLGVLPDDEAWLEWYLATEFEPENGVALLKQFLENRSDALAERFLADMLAAGVIAPAGSPEPDDEETLIETFAEKYGITMTVSSLPSTYSVGVTGRELRTDNWECTLRYEGRSAVFSYGMGEGHNGREPEVDEVLQSLVDESWGLEDMDLEEWARNYGYEIDDEEQLEATQKIYDTCVTNREKLIALVGQELIEAGKLL